MTRLVLALARAGCGAAAPCASSLACADGEVCGASGACEALRRQDERFASSRWLAPSRARVAGHGRALGGALGGALGDVLALGGDRDTQALLSFSELPEPGRIGRATLVLHPHPSGLRFARAGALAVERVGRFDRELPPPQAPYAAVGRVALPAGPTRIVRVDLTRDAVDAARAPDRTLRVRLRLEGLPRAAFVSPLVPERDHRPRLELLIR
ncbi:MAG: hypothetical protein IT378_00730 [Sandaracinaceae bacterium]|nr:hypothetical protein [Sandaracinaceae bacterium]